MKKKHLNNLNAMMCLDIYLAQLTDVEYQKIKYKLQPSHFNFHPLMSHGLSTHLSKIKVETDFKLLQKLAQQHKWRTDLEAILDKPYQALVLTDNKLIIEWVNEGFTEMTGYLTKYAIGKTPKFLQGINTSKETRNRIREKLNLNESFEEEIINYRQNKEEYICRVEIYQIQNSQNQITHFLALESELV